MPPLLEVKGLLKSYNAPVLRDFDFELAAGEVHALVGSNGAGKSTFARVLCGMTPPDGGQLLLGGSPHLPSSRPDAARNGVIMVMQELNIIPTLSVAENLFLERLPSFGGFIRYGALERNAREALSRVGLQDLDPFLPAAALGVGQQQMVEIAAGLTRECRIMILDEPTAALTNREVESLFENIRKLRSQGVGIIYISHRMDEIRIIADRITVLRDGTRVATHATGEIDPALLVRQMAGHDMSQRPEGATTAANVAVLRVSNVRLSSKTAPVSFEAHAGEILGIAGLAGSGRSELLKGIYDSGSRISGKIELEGKSLSGGPEKSARAGLGLVPEDRKSEGLLLSLPIRTNVTLSTLDKHSNFFGWISNRLETETTQKIARDLDVRCASEEQLVGQLSGGNQQKVLLGRWLARDCSVLLLDEPTRGVDAAAKDQIHGLLRGLAAQGKTLVVVSSELEELMALSHRILVLSAGRLTGEFFPDSWSRESITKAAFSGYLNCSTT